MDFFQKNNFPSEGNLFLQKTFDNNIHLYFKGNILVGFGKVDTSYSEDKMDFKGYGNDLRKLQLSDTISNEGIYMLVTAQEVWACPITESSLVGRKFSDIDSFLSYINPIIAHINEQLELKENEDQQIISDLEGEIKELKNSHRELTQKEESLNNKIKWLENENQELKKKHSVLKLEMKTDFIRNTILLSILKNKIKPAQYEIINSDKYELRNCDNISEVSILNIMDTDFILKVRVKYWYKTYSEGSSSDGIPAHSLSHHKIKYLIITENGELLNSDFESNETYIKIDLERPEKDNDDIDYEKAGIRI